MAEVFGRSGKSRPITAITKRSPKKTLITAVRYFLIIRSLLRFSDCLRLLLLSSFIFSCALPSELEIQEGVVAVSDQCNGRQDQHHNRANDIININRVRHHIAALEPPSRCQVKIVQQRRGSDDRKNQEENISNMHCDNKNTVFVSWLKEDYFAANIYLILHGGNHG